MHDILTWSHIIPFLIFGISFLCIVFEPFDKSIIALSGAIAMVLTGILTATQAIEAIEFETILLLLGMMMLVHMASKSGVLSWLNVQIITFTKGNPLLIFLLFSGATAVFSAVLDNVTTVILMVPLIIQLLKSIGKDPKLYIFAIILFSNIGGGLTLIGDPPNIIIGGAMDFSFLDFIQNLWIPITSVAIIIGGYFLIRFRKRFQSITHSLTDLHLTFLLIEKIKQTFLSQTFHKLFVIQVLFILSLTITGFLLQEYWHIPAFVFAFAGAISLAIISRKHIDIHESFRSVEWSTLFFFAGLFIIVRGIESTGALEWLSQYIVSSTQNILYLSLLILWVSGLISMVLDNIPFVAVMIPVLLGIQSSLGDVNTDILWWSLSLGACLGGNGTLIGASANIVSANIARKNDIHIGFLEYTKFSFPLTIAMLAICSLSIYFTLSL